MYRVHHSEPHSSEELIVTRSEVRANEFQVNIVLPTNGSENSTGVECWLFKHKFKMQNCYSRS